jgi:hypothetical protein
VKVIDNKIMIYVDENLDADFEGHGLDDFPFPRIRNAFNYLKTIGSLTNDWMIVIKRKGQMAWECHE